MVYIGNFSLILNEGQKLRGKYGPFSQCILTSGIYLVHIEVLLRSRTNMDDVEV